MMKGWKEITIGDLGKVVTGNTPPKKDPDNYGGEYPFIKPTDMEIDRRHVTDWEENYSEKAYKKYQRSYIPPKSTGVVTIGTVGEKLFQADRWCFTNQSVNVVIPNEQLYDPDFVYYLLKINLPKVENANPGTASGRHHVSKSNFCAIKLWVPESKEIQRRIASILSAYDDLIENNLKRIKLLEEKAQLTYEEWFVRMRFPGHEKVKIDKESGLPEGWETNKLEKVLQASNGKSFKGKYIQKFNMPVYGSNGIIGQSDIYNNEESIIIGRVGAYCGSIKYCKDRFWATDNTITVTSLEERMPNLLAYYILKKYDLRNMAGGAAQPLLTQRLINSLEILTPTKTIAKEFNNVVSKSFNTILNLQNQNRLLKEARDILLPRLMTGMIDVDKLKLESVEDYLMVAEDKEKYGKSS